MTVFDYLLMLAFTIGLSMVLDHIWLTYVRPILTRWRGWPEVDPSERIPLSGWAIALFGVATMFIILPFVGFVAGY